jgi:predicted ATP-grasp superfamily ATP-dependent carboligase
MHGKAVLYAPHTLTFPEQGPWQAALRDDLEDLAVPFGDLPHTGAVIEAGQPVLTLFASASDVETCTRGLREAAAEVLSSFPSQRESPTARSDAP